ncbi:Sequence-specific DNA binding transcription factors,DNA binding,DNA binding isoform 2 [Theobroma cacao]|uniref:Sequence-specific DNA binding transcription factors,DNA binding,DNA binding isoform 2 n=1 Tax=Theobroma cacao TaxID=3641 RepID=A0A061G852_THECC|nr:Sequence-specific DNA binding transcription factors,DNA binding,DNA binding isoform 2 [Theobroma cacao]
METGKEEETHVFLDPASRPTKGKRMTKLLDEEAEEDELFWNQEAFKEEDNDANYEEELEVADVFDSDFDEDEPEPDDEAENETEERVRTKKRLIFPGKPSMKKKKKKKVLSKLDGDPKDEKSTQKPTSPQHHDAPDDAEGERIIRKSTRTSVIVRQAERDAIRAALQATMKAIKRKKEGEEKRITQEEMLLEAAQTEIMNLRNLERVLAREEEVKKRAIIHKPVYSGPQIKYVSKDGCSYLEFSKGSSFQSELSTTLPPYPEKAICAVTGLPAKYRDPKTGLSYATKEAFKIIRERFENEHRSAPKEMDMGVLFDSLSGKGLMPRQRRSQISNRSQTSRFQYLGHFHRTPTDDDEESD